jgi:putative membrane protein
MADFFSEYYLWLKAFHIIAVMAWMAGMLYLPRLFVYHCQTEPGSEMSEKLKIMERRLMKVIINPAMIVAFILGIILMIVTKAGAPGGLMWFHYKAALLVGLFTVHGMLSKYRKAFEKDQNKKSEKFYRILNEVPTLLMIGIVVLAVVKPF